MVDITNFCFTKVKAAVLAVDSTATVQKRYQSTVVSFPYVTFLDLDNSEFSHTLDYKQRKSHVSWQVDIYATGGTSEIKAKKIRDAIVKVMQEELNMTCDTAKPTTDAADTTIYRYTMVFSCNIDEDTQRI